MQIGAARQLLQGNTRGLGDWTHGKGSITRVAPVEDGVFLSEGGQLEKVTRDGQVAWSQEVGGYASSPAASPTHVYVVSEGRLKAFDHAGIPQWSREVGEAGDPAVDAQGNVFVTAGGRLKGFSSQGEMLTDKRLKPWLLRADSYTDPAVTPQGLVVVASKTRWVKAFTAEGKEAWSYQLPGELTTGPSVGEDGSIAFATWDNLVVKLGPDGRERWRTPLGGEAASMVPLIGLDGAVHAANGEDQVVRLEPEDGQPTAKRALRGGPVGEPDLGPDGSVYVSSYLGSLHRLEPRTLTETWSADLDIHIGTSSPQVTSEGTVYVNRSKEGLLALREQRTVDSQARELASLAEELAQAPEEEASAIGRTQNWLLVGGVRVPVKKGGP